MVSIFVLTSMAILGITTISGIFTNCVIVSVNLVEKVKGKSLGSSDLILVTLGLSNITFQFVMTTNDFLSLLWSELYYSDEVYATFNALLFFPIYASFWFTVCLCVYYCLQIVIFTNPFLLRLKSEIPKLVPCFLVAAILTSVVISVPAIWSTYREVPSEDVPFNMSLENNVPKLSITYLLPTNIIGCSIPLILVGISNSLILKSLGTNSKNLEKITSNTSSTRTGARERAARTVGWLLVLYLAFYISEIMMFVDLFPPSSIGFCICLMVIYIYSPAQSVILILGSPKLRKAMQSFLKLLQHWDNKTIDNPEILFVNLQVHKGCQ
ncbi:taste receptor type 2 member 40-like [Bufo bufo]|uniref:taste receptor type 2 member 40-like n=1 Tax=Bufo bufo TaxID=8384 RepID=UPI001ABE2004|nr:taste receptor type 2 member 40-like [Bufo bufo]